jgi:hypothetical protein
MTVAHLSLALLTSTSPTVTLFPKSSAVHFYPSPCSTFPLVIGRTTKEFYFCWPNNLIFSENKRKFPCGWIKRPQHNRSVANFSAEVNHKLCKHFAKQNFQISSPLLCHVLRDLGKSERNLFTQQAVYWNVGVNGLAVVDCSHNVACRFC